MDIYDVCYMFLYFPIPMKMTYYLLSAFLVFKGCNLMHGVIGCPDFLTWHEILETYLVYRD